ncbi:hypothetical protein HGM15179_007347 [Zosterops borbonicus]|uniref:Uncharacterized protein n=1 Tax=Zosterops borbonicus TaxID=364589 RepID=A0A8K1GL19_9PASS|nr:hypothetical protein HGM15179_007347 [Zosterops borbonicus]
MDLADQLCLTGTCVIKWPVFSEEFQASLLLDENSKMDTLHKLKILVMFLSLATFIVMVIMNAGNATGTFKGLFRTTPGNISAKYSTAFTPAGWTFLIWNVIYSWQLVWLLYALSGICRRNEFGYAFIKPDLLPTPFYVAWCLNNGLNVGWLFLWDREYLLPALVFLVVLSLTTCASLFVSHRALSIHSSWFVKGHRAELWLIRILVQNGLALYLTWTSIATLLNFAVVLIYKWDVPDEKATTAALSILALGLVVWFYLENYFLDKYVRYNLTVYPVVIAALAGSAYRNSSFSSPHTNNIFIGAPGGHTVVPAWLEFGLHMKQKSVVGVIVKKNMRKKKEENSNNNEKNTKEERTWSEIVKEHGALG